jgi:hypothetical protein
MPGSPRAFELDADDDPTPDAFVMVDHPLWPRARKVRLDKLLRSIQAGGTLGLPELVLTDTVVGPTSSPHPAVHRDVIPCDSTAGVVEIVLPAGAGSRQWVKVYDIGGAAGDPHVIRVLPQAGQTVMGQADYFLVDLPYGELYVALAAGATAWLPKED